VRVLLLYPHKKVLGLDYLGPPVTNIGFLYIAAVLEKDGFEVGILDALANEMSALEVVAAIKESSPDLIGITATTPTANSVLELAGLLKQELSEIPIVLGGPHFSFKAEQTLENHPEIDLIVRGEGEYAFRDLIRAIDRNSSLDEVNGLTYRLENGSIISTPDRKQISNLDELPYPAYHLIDLSKYGWLIKDPVSMTISSSRGCLGGCSFCASYVFWRREWRTRSPESLAAEVEYLASRFNARLISFTDECFTWDIKRVERFFDLILKANLDVRFFFQARVDHIVKMKEIMPRLRRAGLIMVFTGLESADRHILKSFNKPLDSGVTEEAFRILRQNGILSWASFIVGGPDDTVQSYRQNEALIKRINPDFIGFQTYSIFPGTGEHNRHSGEAIDWNLMDGVSNIYSSKTMGSLKTKLCIQWLKSCFPAQYSEYIPERIKAAFEDTHVSVQP